MRASAAPRSPPTFLIVGMVCTVVMLLLFQDISRNRAMANLNAPATSTSGTGEPVNADGSVNLGSTATTASSTSDDTLLQTASEDILTPSYGGRVHVSLCEGCAFGSYYKQLKERIETELPGVPVVGSNYPVPALNRYLSHAVTALQLVLGVAPYQFGNYLPERFKPAVEFIKEKPIMFGMGVWFGGNTLKQKLTATNAFEVAYDGKLISSRLQTGRFPDPNEVIDEIRRIRETFD